MKRSFSHFTPKYIYNRLSEIFYRKKKPGLPWLTKDANNILESYLKKTDVGIELGSGGSTLWFAEKVCNLTSIEHNPQWHDRVKDMLKNTKNVNYLFFPQDKPDDLANESAYVDAVKSLEPQSLDFGLVDGIYRDYCALNLLDKIRPGGVLIIDNVNWFLPSDTKAPYSRTLEQGPRNEVWEQVYKEISAWRNIWTSSGVTDTAFFFKP